MKQLLEQVEYLEMLIFVYADRDSVRTKQLEAELSVVNQIILARMVS
jgi:hypothetical protein